MNAVDASVLVAGFASWHESHDAARRALDARPRLVAHCALEAFSVLTRLPPPYRVPAPLVVEFLADRFGAARPLQVHPDDHTGMVAALSQRGIDGGSVYDGLVALSAAAHGAMLLTVDRRAAETYRRCGVDHRLLT